MCQLKICVLGQFTAQYEECPPIRFVSLKEQELLSYLVLRRDRTHARELVAGVLWGNTSIHLSKKYLCTELWRLRNDTKPPDGSSAPVIASRGWVRINPEAEVWSDVNVLESTYDLVRSKAAERLSPQEAALLEQTVRLYEGPLLDGWYQDWFQTERDRLHQIYLEIADKLMAYYEAFGCYEEGIALGLRVLCEEPTQERTHRRLMRFFFHAGDRAKALEQFSRCTSILRDTLDVEPSAETSALRQQLRVGSLKPLIVGESQRDGVGLATILQRVDDLQRQLDSLRSQLENEIKVHDRGAF